MLGWFTDRASRLLRGVTHIIGKAQKVGHAVGKGVTTFASALTPDADAPPMLTGISKTLARMSKASYDSQRPQMIDGYTYEPSLSTYNVAVYCNHTAKQVIIAFRGTASAEDIKSDIAIIKGSANEQRFQNALAVYNKVKQAFPDYSIMATGHSLGGSLALYLNSQYGIPVEVFNAGMGLGFLKSNPHASNAVLHIIKGDAISAFAGLGNLGKVIVSKSIYPDADPLKAHAMANFL